MTDGKLERKFPTVPYSEYDALCDLLVAVADELGTDPVRTIRREFGNTEAEWVARIIDGERTEELFRG